MTVILIVLLGHEVMVGVGVGVGEEKLQFLRTLLSAAYYQWIILAVLKFKYLR